MSKPAKDIFLTAGDIADPAKRGAYLDQACGDDASLRRRVEALLRAQADPDSFLDHPAVAEQPALSADGTQATDTPKGLVDTPEAAAEETIAEAPAAEDAVLSFLAPPQRKGSLGRLDHYEVLEVLGKGAFGTVFKAFDEKLHRVAAIKILSPELAASGPAKARFLREARAAAAVRHENVVGIYVVEDKTAVPYLVMEYIEGQTLQGKLDATGPLGVKEILRIGYQIACGLAAAHHQGLIHRDIKPANILLENGVERVKITDFGLARAMDDANVTQSGVVAGTPMYMSPEQAEGLTLDRRSDLFSLGTVLYAMCTGRPRFRASGTMAVLKRVCEDTPRPIREINSEIPQWLCDIITKLHAKKPEDRYQSAKEVADVLAKYLSEIQLHGAVHVGQAASLPAEGAAGAEALRSPGEPATSPVASAGPLEIQPRPPARKRRRWRGPAIAASALAVVLTLLELTGVTHLGEAIRLMFPPDGMLVVQVEDPDLGVRIDGNEAITTGRGPYTFRLRSGTHRLDVFQGGVLIQSESIDIPIGPCVVTKTVRRPDAGWVQLWSGKDLSGWKAHPKRPGDWRMDNGVLVGSGATPGILVSERGSLSPVPVRLEIMVSEGGEAGLYFAASGTAATEPELSAGIRLQGTRKSPGAAHALLDGAEVTVACEPGRWYTFQTKPLGSLGNEMLWQWLDRDGKECTMGVARAPAGHLFLRTLKPGTVVSIRKIEIRELPTETKAPAESATLRFEIDDPDLTLAVNGDVWSRPEGDKKRIVERKVPAGAYRWHAQDRQAQIVSTQDVTLKAGESRTIEILRTLGKEPSAPRLIKRFEPAKDKPLIPESAIVEGDAWRIEVPKAKEGKGAYAVPLVELVRPSFDEALLICKGSIKAVNPGGYAYFSVTCKSGGGTAQSCTAQRMHVKGTSDWQPYEAAMLLRSRGQWERVIVNVTIVGGGTVWIKDLELLQAPLPGTKPEK